MVAGWQINVSTPPRLSARVQSLTDSSTILAASSEPTSNETMPPKPCCCVLPGRAVDATSSRGSKPCEPSDALPGMQQPRDPTYRAVPCAALTFSYRG